MPQGKDQETSDDKNVDAQERLDSAIDAIEDVTKRLEAARADEEDEEMSEDEEDMSGPLAEVAKAMKGFKEMLEGIKSEAKEKQDKYDELKGQFDALKADFENKEDEEHEMSEDMEDKDDRQDAADEEKARLDWYNERRELEDFAGRYKLDSEDVDDLENAELRRKIVEAHVGEERTDASDSEIKGAFDLIKDLRKDRDESYDRASDIVTKGRQDGTGSSEDKARESYRDRMYNGWKDQE